MSVQGCHIGRCRDPGPSRCASSQRVCPFGVVSCPYFSLGRSGSFGCVGSINAEWDPLVVLVLQVSLLGRSVAASPLSDR